jgi:excisionase family DNA binding protein
MASVQEVEAPESTGARLVRDFEHLPAVLTTREAAKALRIGVKEVRSLVDAGQIPAARFGPPTSSSPTLPPPTNGARAVLPTPATPPGGR